MKDKVLLKAKLETDGEGRYFQNVRDATTLGSFWATCIDMVVLTVEAKASGCTPRPHTLSPCFESLRTPRAHTSPHISIIVTVQIATGPVKLAKPTRQRCEKNTEDETKFKELVKVVYGEHPGHYAEGEWISAATELMHGTPAWVSTRVSMRRRSS
jgi:hypothetical protein